MRETVSISLPEEIKTELDKAVVEEGLSRSDLVRQAVKDFLFIRRFRSLRARLVSQTQATGLFNDEDVFERISCE